MSDRDASPAAPGLEAADGQTSGATRYITALRRRWLLILVLPLIAGGVAWAVTRTGTKLYDATAALLLNSENQVAALLNPNAQPSANPERDLNTNVALIKQIPIADAVRKQLGLRLSSAQLLNEVTTSVELSSTIVDITVRDRVPARAASIADALATQYVAFRQSSAQADIDQAAALAQQQYSALSAAQRATPDGQALLARLRELQLVGHLQTANTQIIHFAQVPTRPSRPRPLVWALVGALLALVVAIAIALALELASRRLREEAEVTQIFRRPVLGVIPRPPARHLPTSDPDTEQEEAYRTLAASLRFFKVGRHVRTLLITSPSPADGKTSVTLELAAALTELGQRVVAIECDLRRPRFADVFGLPPTGGLSAILAGLGPSLEAELIPIDVVTRRPADRRAKDPGTYFSVVPCGEIPPNPQGLLSREALREVLEAAGANADVVLIDTAPIGTVSDALAAADVADAITIVSRLGATRRDAAHRTKATLDNLGTEVLGTVITGAPRVRHSYYYGYQASWRDRLLRPGQKPERPVPGRGTAASPPAEPAADRPLGELKPSAPGDAEVR